MGGLLLGTHADQSCGEFLPVGSGSEPFEVEKAATAEHGVGDADNSAQPPQGLLIDLVPAEQVGVVAEVSEEPAEFPQGSESPFSAAPCKPGT